VSEDITECMDAVKWGGTYVMMQFISFHFNGCGVVQVVAHLGSGLGGLLLLLCHLFVHLDDDSRAALRYPSRVCQGQESRSLLTRRVGCFCAVRSKTEFEKTPPFNTFLPWEATCAEMQEEVWWV
jgi:hypothetical protein